MTFKAKKEKGLGSSLQGWLRLGGFVGLVLTLVPLFFVVRVVSVPKAQKIPRVFHRGLSALLGLRLRVRGKIAEPSAQDPILYVCNHSSYLDIPALGGVVPASFVAKAEVSGWPFIGAMSKLQDTVFIERKTVRAGKHRDVLRENLEKGRSLIVFPEGTSSDGMRTLPFKSTLFSVVEKPLEKGHFIRVQPVSILCTEIGGMPIGRSWRPYYAWFGDMTLVKHAWQVFRIASFTVDIIFHPPVTVQEMGNRKLLSAYCERVIAEGVDGCVTGRGKKLLAGPR